MDNKINILFGRLIAMFVGLNILAFSSGTVQAFYQYSPLEQGLYPYYIPGDFADNPCLAGGEISVIPGTIPDTTAQRVAQNSGVYKQVAEELGVQWQIIAALHVMEYEAQASNPSNGQGAYQLYTLVVSQGAEYFNPGSIDSTEFLRQTRLAANFFMAKANAETKTAIKNGEAWAIKQTFFAYNGLAPRPPERNRDELVNPARIKEGLDPYPPSTPLHEFAAYVMNGADAYRQGLYQIYEDRGNDVNRAARPGAYVVFKALGGEADESAVPPTSLSSDALETYSGANNCDYPDGSNPSDLSGTDAGDLDGLFGSDTTYGGTDSGGGSVSFSYLEIAADTDGMPHSKAAADIDKDGHVDVLVATYSGNSVPFNGTGMFWYKNPGNAEGTWTKHRIGDGNFTTDMEVGDIDGDGWIDAASTRDGRVVWYKNPGGNAQGTWGNPITVISGADGHDISIAQLDGNGYQEIVIRGSNSFSNDGGGDKVILASYSGGSWKNKTITVPKGEGLEIGRIDNDSFPDIVAGSAWYKNPGGNIIGGSWAKIVTNPSYESNYTMHTKVDVGDINKDGNLDIAIVASEPGNPDLGNLYRPMSTTPVVWLENPGGAATGTWTMHNITDMSDETHGVAVADFDGDGDLDVASAEMEQSSKKRVKISYNLDGSGTSWSDELLSNDGSHNIEPADLNGDGIPDLIGANHGWQLRKNGNKTPVQAWLSGQSSGGGTSRTGEWTHKTIGSVSSPWKNVFIVYGDFDKDGDNDLAVSNTIFTNQGNGLSYGTQNIGAADFLASLVLDIDGDGDLDIFGTRQTSGTSGASASITLAWAENNGSGGFTVNSVSGTTGTGDFLQGVGYLSSTKEFVLSWHGGNSSVELIKVPTNPKSGTWSKRSIPNVSENEEVNVVDLDGDGDQDIVTGEYWLQNSGGNFTRRTVYSAGGRVADRNAVGDINGDGKIDVAIGFEGGGQQQVVAWYAQGSSATNSFTQGWSDQVIGPMSLDLKDYDRDGDLDMAVGEHDPNAANASRMKMYIMENDGRGIFTKIEVGSGQEHHDGAQFVDLDGDGDLDIASIGWTHKNVNVYLGN